MNKMTNSKAKYCIQWETHPKFAIKGLCSLMEHQSLVDIAICCGNNTLHAHKCVLAACSPLFKEAFEKNSLIEQVIMSGCDFNVMKSIIEIMYCGETTISEEYVKYLIAAAKLFQMKSLENLFMDRSDYHYTADEVFLPQPQFLSKKPKYPTAYNPLNHNSAMTNPTNILKPVNYNMTNPYTQRKFKRKYVTVDAEKACAKEAQASRMALANLQKEIANAPQVNSFIIEDSCTETTVENFIPHTDENYVDKLNELQQIQMVNYADLDSSVYVPPNQFMSNSKPQNLIQFSVQTNSQSAHGLMADKMKHILGHDVSSNVEIMYKTSDGNFVTVTDDVLQSLSKGGLQYQVVDEHGQVGEVRELEVIEQDSEQGKYEKDRSEEKCEGDEVPGKIAKIVADDYISTDFLRNSQDNVTVTDGNLASFFLPSDMGKAVDFLTINENIFACTTLAPTVVPLNTANTYSYTDGYSGFVNGEDKMDENVDKGNDKMSNGEGSKVKMFSPDMFFADMPIIGDEDVTDLDKNAENANGETRVNTQVAEQDQIVVEK